MSSLRTRLEYTYVLVLPCVRRLYDCYTFCVRVLKKKGPCYRLLKLMRGLQYAATDPSRKRAGSFGLGTIRSMDGLLLAFSAENVVALPETRGGGGRGKEGRCPMLQDEHREPCSTFAFRILAAAVRSKSHLRRSAAQAR